MHRHRVNEPVARRARSLRLVRSSPGNSASDSQAFASAPAFSLNVGNSLSLGNRRSLASMMGRPSAARTVCASVSTGMQLPRPARAARPLAGGEPMLALAVESVPVAPLFARHLGHTCQHTLRHQGSKSLPNPSLERTRKGRPRYTECPFSVPRGLPLRSAQLKR